MTCRVLVVDDDPTVRHLLSAVFTFDDEPDLALIGMATNLEEGRWMTSDLRPEVVLLDLLMPDAPRKPSEVVNAIREVAPETTRIFIMSASSNVIGGVAVTTADGFVDKSSLIGRASLYYLRVALGMVPDDDNDTAG